MKNLKLNRHLELPWLTAVWEESLWEAEKDTNYIHVPDTHFFLIEKLLGLCVHRRFPRSQVSDESPALVKHRKVRKTKTTHNQIS
jgi:hypothetical protein